MTTKERILQYLPEEELLFVDGFDDAIIGFCNNSLKIVYDVDLMLEILVSEQLMHPDDAIEHLEFNIFCAYVGEQTPIYVNMLRYD
jgi:hypothetical protein